MALEFNPPPAWLMQEYVNRKNPGEIASEGVGSALKTYALMKEKQTEKQTDSNNKAMDTYVKAYEAGGPKFAADVAKSLGLKNPPAPGASGQPPAQSSGTAPSPDGTIPMDANNAPIGGPMQGPPNAPVEGPQLLGTTPAAPSSGMGAPSPIIDHWNQTMAPGMQKTPSPGIGINLPQNKNPLANAPELLDQGKWGASQLDKSLKLKEAESKYGPKTPITKEGLLEKGSYDPNTDYVVEPPANNSDEKDRRREDQLAKAVTDYGKQIETNPIIKNLETQQIGLHAVEEMSHLVADGNTVASSAMGMKMARAMGEVGVVTENDVKRYVQSKKLTQAAGDKLSAWVHGTPSDATLDEVNQISKVLGESYDTKIQPIYNRYIERFSRAYKITPEDASYRLAIPYKQGSSGGSSKGGAMPEVGGTFMGGRVLSVKQVSKS